MSLDESSDNEPSDEQLISDVLQKMKSKLPPSDPVASVVESLNSDRINELEEEIKRKDEKIARLEKQFEEKDAAIADFDKRLKEKDEKIAHLNKQMQEKDGQLTSLFLKNEELTLESSRLKSELTNVNSIVDMLRADALEATGEETTKKARAPTTKKKKETPSTTEPPSMYKLLKEKKRKTKKDSDYAYSGRKRAAKQQRHPEAATSKKDESDIIDVPNLPEVLKNQEKATTTSTQQIISTFKENQHLTEGERDRIIKLIETEKEW